MEGNINVPIDMEKYIADAAWDGLKRYITNTSLPEKRYW